MIRLRKTIALLGLLVVFVFPRSHAEPQDQAMDKACRAIEHMVSGTDDLTLRSFIDQHLTAAYRQSLTASELTDLLQRIRTAAAGFGGVGLDVLGDSSGRATFMRPGSRVAVAFDIDPGSGRISRLELLPEETTPHIKPITWANLDARLDEEAAAGFSGSVLAVRNDSIVLYRGYGLADREHGIPVDTNTIFAIGSTPIDFTHAAILKLEEMGKLSTDDTITRFIDNVPPDKRDITLHQLMIGASGLPNFHDRPGDTDPDLTWIDRQTAIDRIMKQDLLFAPGTNNRHSHSAWVLLAAIVEKASGKSYEDFLRTQFFEPAGMDRTGNYPITKSFPEAQIAVGYGMSRPTEINSPVYWGPTSWLVMGSGGMVSTPADLYRWHRAMLGGKFLGPEALTKYPLDAVGVGGNDRGFLNWFAYNGRNAVILCSNSHVEMEDHAAMIGRALEELVEQ